MVLGGRIVFWLYLFFLVWAYGTVFNWADPDLWHRLALGEYLFRTGHFPEGGTFSYLADYKLIPDHEWGSAVIFYGIYRAVGDEANFGIAMVGLKLVTLALTITLIAWAGLRRQPPSVPLAAFLALVLFALLPSFLSTLRCMAFTHIFFALWLYWFQCERTGTRIPSFAYVAVMLLWANLHGGFVIGLLWLALVTGCEWLKRGAWGVWLMRLGLCLLVTFVNPFGWRLWQVTLRALSAPRHGFSEWGLVSWFSGDYPGYKLLIFVTLLAFAYLFSRRRGRELDFEVLGLIGVFLFLSLTSARHTSLFAVAAGALLPGTLPSAPRPSRVRTPPRRLVYMAICSVCILVPFYMALAILPGDGLRLAYSPDSTAVNAIGFLKRSGMTGNLLAPFNLGSYAMWELRGQMRVSMDGRYDLVYKPATYDRVSDFYLGKPDGLSLLNDPKPDAILVPQSDAIYRRLLADPAWREAFHGAHNAVFLPAPLQ